MTEDGNGNGWNRHELAVLGSLRAMEKKMGKMDDSLRCMERKLAMMQGERRFIWLAVGGVVSLVGKWFVGAL